MTISPDRPGSTPPVPYLDTLVAAVYTTLSALADRSVLTNPEVASLREQLRFGITWWRSILDDHRPVDHPSRGYTCPTCRTSVLRRPVAWPCGAWDRTSIHLATLTSLESRLIPPRKPSSTTAPRVSIPLSPYSYRPRHLLAG
ncbi:hypothetical protein [Allokutzneria albata]|uniref:Uncharacterized protein n=1 Tax=Allokutzneria albata TaxID=211114 RepID=A0A1G9US84_ALLAB|nr:hypothetical protein [Allokutzneria albata]SDM62746.1 hypothetical protein SAMN04489726_2585 [Allokutzneria albata]